MIKNYCLLSIFLVSSFSCFSSEKITFGKVDPPAENTAFGVQWYTRGIVIATKHISREKGEKDIIQYTISTSMGAEVEKKNAQKRYMQLKAAYNKQERKKKK